MMNWGVGHLSTQNTYYVPSIIVHARGTNIVTAHGLADLGRYCSHLKITRVHIAEV